MVITSLASRRSASVAAIWSTSTSRRISMMDGTPYAFACQSRACSERHPIRISIEWCADLQEAWSRTHCQTWLLGKSELHIDGLRVFADHGNMSRATALKRSMRL